MIKDPTPQEVTVTRARHERPKQKPREDLGPMEREAYGALLRGEISADAYERICRNLRIFRRKKNV